MKIPQSQEYAYLKDRSINNLAVILGSDTFGRSIVAGYFLISNMDSCKLINETFLCNPSLMKKVLNDEDSCITRLYNSDCRSFKNYDCYKVNKKCGFEKAVAFDEFTKLFDKKCFALFSRKANFIYKCEDGREKKGELEF